jgi:hypothetical protein
MTTRVTAQFARSVRRPSAQAGWMERFAEFLPAFVGHPCRQEPQRMQLWSVYDMTASSGASFAAKPAATVVTQVGQSVRSRTPSRCSTRSR